MPADLFSKQIEMLRVRLETAYPSPFFLVVSSARDDDGKSILAWALARAMESAGHSTLLVLADELTHDVEAGREPKSLDDLLDFGISPYIVRAIRPTPNLLSVPGDGMRHAVSRHGVSRFADACRASFQVTVVEATCAFANSFSMFAATLADGVLVSVREGRRVHKADRALAQTLEGEPLPFLGVVTVAANLIRSATKPRVESARRIVPVVAGDIEANREEQTV